MAPEIFALSPATVLKGVLDGRLCMAHVLRVLACWALIALGTDSRPLNGGSRVVIFQRDIALLQVTNLASTDWLTGEQKFGLGSQTPALALSRRTGRSAQLPPGGCGGC